MENNFGIVSGLDCYISAFVGMYAGIAVDKYNRKNLLAGAILIFSMTSIITGTASSLGMICLMRLILGAAESAFMPATYSLIQDLFPQKMRSRANAIIASGNFIGDGMASLYIIFISTFGWRAAIMNMGCFGAIISLLVFTLIKEPKRGASEDAPVTGIEFVEEPQ